MLTIDVNAVTNMLVNRLKVDVTPDGSAELFREKLGTYLDELDVPQPGIIHARHLPDPDKRPDTPFCAYREGPILTRDRIIQVPTYRLFFYDDPDQGYWRIDELLPLAGKAIAANPKLRVSVGAIIGEIAVVSVSGSSSDPALGGLLWRNLQVAIDTTW